MESYLTTTVDKLRSSKFNDLTFVLGNESCDLDSAVCAVTYAAFLHWQYMQIKCKACTRLSRDESTYKDDIFVPILNVDRNDYELKTEVNFCMKEQSIDNSKLVFRDDFDLRSLVGRAKTSVVLVDHHILAKKDRFLVDHVTEIIDHRPIDRNDWKYKEDTRTSIELVGSCASLITHRIRNLSALLSKETDFFSAYPTATHMLHSVIILDTVNFSKEVNKATPVDEEAVLFLETLIKPTNCLDERKSKLDRLVAARKDVSGLSAAQLLRKDVKIVGRVIVPSFPILVEELLSKPDASQAIADMLRLSDCDIALLLGMCVEDNLQRDAAVYAEHNDIRVKFAKFLQEWQSPKLSLTQREVAESKNCLYFKQANLSASRKQFMPAVNEFCNLVNKK